MRRLIGSALLGAAGLLWLAQAGIVHGQDTLPAKATRANLKKIIIDEVDWKEEMTRVIFDDLKRESNNKVTFKIDNASGMSNNSRMSYKAKKVSIEKILNDLADKYDFGWYVYSDPKDPNAQMNGRVILRKSKAKERGYEAGKEPKEKSAALERDRHRTESAAPTSGARNPLSGFAPWARRELMELRRET